MVFHWRLSDSKSPQVTRTLLSILAIFNNTVIWMVSTRPPTSKSSPFNNPLVTEPKAPITIGIIVTFMFHSFFNSLARSRYLSLFSHSFSFILWSAETAKSTILQIFFFFFFLLIIIRSGLRTEIRWSVCILKSHRSLFGLVSLFNDISTLFSHRKWTRQHEFKSWTRLIAFHIALIPLGKVWIQLFSLQLWVNSKTEWVLQP